MLAVLAMVGLGGAQGWETVNQAPGAWGGVNQEQPVDGQSTESPNGTGGCIDDGNGKCTTGCTWVQVCYDQAPVCTAIQGPCKAWEYTCLIPAVAASGAEVCLSSGLICAAYSEDFLCKEVGTKCVSYCH